MEPENFRIDSIQRHQLANGLTILIPKTSVGSKEILDPELLRSDIALSCRFLEAKCSAQDIGQEVFRTLYDGISTKRVQGLRTLRSGKTETNGYSRFAAPLFFFFLGPQ